MLSWETELRRTQAIRHWQERLQDADCLFARLIYVSCLRDASGRYVDPYLLGICPARMCNMILAEVHREIFREWLQLSLRSKMKDLKAYSDSVTKGTDDECAWVALCREAIPSGISIQELKLFREAVKRLVPFLTELHNGTR